MADRYWRGGAGTWNTTSTTNWSTTSGGAGGASVPTAADSVFFDQAGTYNVTLTGALTCLDFNVSAGTVTFINGTSPTLAISGSMSIISSTNWTSTGGITFNATTAKTITTNGAVIGAGTTFNGVGGSWQLLTALTFGAARAVTLTAGTLDLNGFTLSTGSFASNVTTARTLAFGTGNITVVASGTVWNTGTVTNMTVTGTPVVNVTNTTASPTTVVPGALSAANSISFNFTAGTYPLTFLAAANSARDVDFTGFAGTWGAITNCTVYGSLTVSTGMTLTSSNGAITFAATSGTKTITSSGKTFNFPLTFNGVGGTWQLQDALTMGSTRALVHTNGTLNLNGKTLTVGTAYQTATGTKNLTFNGGTLVCPAAATTAFNNAAPTNFTTTAGTGTGVISMTAATAKTFVGGGSTFNCTLNQGGAGTLTISGANTFNDITNTTQPTTVVFPTVSINTFSNFSLTGTAGNLVSIASNTAGVAATITKSSGTVNVSYCSIKDSVATGGATWNALTANGNVDAGNNLGWFFGAAAYSITASQGSYSISGQTTGITRSRVINASQGTYNLTGQTAGIFVVRSYTIDALPGSYSVSGQSITINRSRLISAQNGVYLVAGQAADITRGGSPTVLQEYFVEIRSFTERRRF